MRRDFVIFLFKITESITPKALCQRVEKRHAFGPVVGASIARPKTKGSLCA